MTCVVMCEVLLVREAADSNHKHALLITDPARRVFVYSDRVL